MAAVLALKWFKAKKTELQAALKAPLSGSRSWAPNLGANRWTAVVESTLVKFFDDFLRDFEAIAPHHAVQSVRDKVRAAKSALPASLRNLWDIEFIANRYIFNPSGDAEETRHSAIWACFDKLDESLKTVGDVFKVSWALSESTIRSVIEKGDDLSYEKRKPIIAKAVKAGLKKSRYSGWTPVGFVDEVYEMLATTWAVKPEPRSLTLNGMRIVVDSPSVSEAQLERYIGYFRHAYGLLKAKGLEAAWYGALVIADKQDVAAGEYNISENIVYVFERPGDDTAYTLIHELGHRYWFKHMHSEQRARFTALVRAHTGAKPKSVPRQFHPLKITRRETSVAEREIEQAVGRAKLMIDRLDTSTNVLGLTKDIVRQMAEIEDAANAVRDQAPDDYLFTPESLEVHNTSALQQVRARKAVQEALAELATDPEAKDALQSRFDAYVDATLAWMHRFVVVINQQVEAEVATMEGGEQWMSTYENNPAPVAPVSNYGRTNIDEAFAEVFAHYALNKDITRDQLESFRTVLKRANQLLPRAPRLHPSGRVFGGRYLGGSSEAVGKGLVRQALLRIDAQDCQY